MSLPFCRFPGPFRQVLYMQPSAQPFRLRVTRSLHANSLSREAVSSDHRTRLSRIWIPTGGITPDAQEDSHAKLLRAGFLRQAYPGIFHLLPLGRRVLNKLESLIDKHMYQIGASKVELSSISSEELWSKSGRLQSGNKELFRLQDRKGNPYLLSPTHEEEITSLVSSIVTSYKDLPILLYQISRKYRDELRPRHGLLRSREFVMKDLYTFDVTETQALQTYAKVRKAYVNLFGELKLPFMVAEADSGSIGGSLSHEFHFPTSKGEDLVISCANCDYVANEELAESAVGSRGNTIDGQRASDQYSLDKLSVWRGVSKDRSTLINAWFFKSSASSLLHTSDAVREINMHAIKRVLPDVDTSLEDSSSLWVDRLRCDSVQSKSTKIVNLVDASLPKDVITKLQERHSSLPLLPKVCQVSHKIDHEFITHSPCTGAPINVLRIRSGDACSRCNSGTLRVDRAIELGHTFHLGSRYSTSMDAVISAPREVLDVNTNEGQRVTSEEGSADARVPFQMGCHGIGVSRIIGAVADTLVDDKGLNWPRVMAPFEVVVISINGLEEAATDVYDALSRDEHEDENTGRVFPDVVLDDRGLSFPWKIRDADLVGYPVIIVVGRKWKSDKLCEVQCRRLGIRHEVGLQDLPTFVRSLLEKL